MKTNINQCLKDSFPGLYPFDLNESEIRGEWKEYALLRKAGQYCAMHFKEPKATEVLITVNSLYRMGNIFIQNSIENEFLAEIATQMDMSDLMVYLNKIPNNLQSAFIKVLLETTKRK